MSAETTSTTFLQSEAESGTTIINLSELSAEDQLLIWTKNSFYRFLITDPAAQRGQLARGGRALSSGEAIFLGVTDSSGNEAAESNRHQLSAGTRAVWLATQDGQRRRLVTSVISRLVLIKAAERSFDEFNAATREDDAGLRPLPVCRNYEDDNVDSLLMASW